MVIDNFEGSLYKKKGEAITLAPTDYVEVWTYCKDCHYKPPLYEEEISTLGYCWSCNLKYMTRGGVYDPRSR